MTSCADSDSILGENLSDDDLQSGLPGLEVSFNLIILFLLLTHAHFFFISNLMRQRMT